MKFKFVLINKILLEKSMPICLDIVYGSYYATTQSLIVVTKARKLKILIIWLFLDSFLSPGLVMLIN